MLFTYFRRVSDALQNFIVAESQIRSALIDFLRGLVEFDPAKRWSPVQVAYYLHVEKI